MLKAQFTGPGHSANTMGLGVARRLSGARLDVTRLELHPGRASARRGRPQRVLGRQSHALLRRVTRTGPGDHPA
jgi:hypothetical protein